MQIVPPSLSALSGCSSLHERSNSWPLICSEAGNEQTQIGIFVGGELPFWDDFGAGWGWRARRNDNGLHREQKERRELQGRHWCNRSEMVYRTLRFYFGSELFTEIQ
jgi:hypothetical protein